MTTHPSQQAGLSQCDLVLACLHGHGGDWVPMPLLARHSGAYAVHSRIADLRKRGYQIDHRNLRNGRRILSQYRLTEPAPQPVQWVRLPNSVSSVSSVPSVSSNP